MDKLAQCIKAWWLNIRLSKSIAKSYPQSLKYYLIVFFNFIEFPTEDLKIYVAI